MPGFVSGLSAAEATLQALGSQAVASPELGRGQKRFWLTCLAAWAAGDPAICSWQYAVCQGGELALRALTSLRPT